MRLDPASNPNIDLTRSGPVQNGPQTSAGGAKRSEGNESSFEPTSELDRLLREVREMPDVRDDVVAEARRRSGEGELSTPAAVRETAEAILRDEPSAP